MTPAQLLGCFGFSAKAFEQGAGNPAGFPKDFDGHFVSGFVLGEEDFPHGAVPEGFGNAVASQT